MDPAAHRLRNLPLAARCRLAFLAGALEAWREANGTDPPPDVLARILARYPGDPDELAKCLQPKVLTMTGNERHPIRHSA